jgi:hypothetical protein
MRTNKEFTIRQEDRPGTPGKLCQALAEQNVNILTFQSFPLKKGKSCVHLILDNPAVAKSILDRQKTDCTETEVAKVTLTHCPGGAEHFLVAEAKSMWYPYMSPCPQLSPNQTEEIRK